MTRTRRVSRFRGDCAISLEFADVPLELIEHSAAELAVTSIGNHEMTQPGEQELEYENRKRQ